MFRIVANDQGQQEIQLYDQHTKRLIPDGGNLVNVLKKEGVSSPAVAFIQVANVREGHLPQTGGRGIFAPTALAFAVIASGVFLALRRRNP